MPPLGFGNGVGNEMANARIVRHVGAEDCRIDVAIQHHLCERLAAERQADAVRRIAIVHDMRLLGAEPGHAVEINAVFMPQDPAHPHAGCLRVGAHADTAPLDVLRPHHAFVGAISNAMMLKAPDDRRRQHHERNAGLPGLKKRDDGEFTGIEAAVAPSS